MNDKLSLDPKSSALLVMDFQTAVVEMISAGNDALLARTVRVVHAARNVKMRVIYVVVAFRPGYPEVSPRHPSFGPIRETGRFIEGSPGTEVHAAVAPKPGDVVVTKHRVSAFAGTDLDMVLRSNGIDTLVLAGIPRRAGWSSPRCATPPTPTTASSSSRTAAPTATPRCTGCSPRRCSRGRRRVVKGEDVVGALRGAG